LGSHYRDLPRVSFQELGNQLGLKLPTGGSDHVTSLGQDPLGDVARAHHQEDVHI
jgi:hypothetical protein